MAQTKNDSRTRAQHKPVGNINRLGAIVLNSLLWRELQPTERPTRTTAERNPNQQKASQVTTPLIRYKPSLRLASLGLSAHSLAWWALRAFVGFWGFLVWLWLLAWGLPRYGFRRRRGGFAWLSFCLLRVFSYFASASCFLLHFCL